MSQSDSNEKKRHFRQEKWNREGPEAADDGCTGRSVKAFQLDDLGNVKKRKLTG